MQCFGMESVIRPNSLPDYEKIKRLSQKTAFKIVMQFYCLFATCFLASSLIFCKALTELLEKGYRSTAIV